MGSVSSDFLETSQITRCFFTLNKPGRMWPPKLWTIAFLHDQNLSSSIYKKESIYSALLPQ